MIENIVKKLTYEIILPTLEYEDGMASTTKKKRISGRKNSDITNKNDNKPEKIYLSTLQKRKTKSYHSVCVDEKRNKQRDE